MSDPRYRTISLDGGRVGDVAELGDPEGACVLYFHSPGSWSGEIAHAGDEARALGVRVVVLERQSCMTDVSPEDFFQTVVADGERVASSLGGAPCFALGWSGSAPYALALAALLPERVTAVGVASPLPGPLVGEGAIGEQTPQLQMIATTSRESPWAAAPSAYADFMSVITKWPFDPAAVTQRVTVWLPDADPVVPSSLADELTRQLPNRKVVSVSGEHNWAVHNWPSILRDLTEVPPAA